MASKTLIIKEKNTVVFEAVMHFEETKKYFRVLKDIVSYEKVISDLLNNGYTKNTIIDQKTITFDDGSSYLKDIHGEEVIKFETIDELGDFLSNEGFDCSLIESTNYQLLISIAADGQDMGYEVISNSNKTKVSNVTQHFMKAANNFLERLPYEPIERDRASSYAIDLFSAKEDNELIVALQNLSRNISSLNLDPTKIWEKGPYYNLIKSLIDLIPIKHLSFVKISANEEDFTISKEDLKKISQNFDQILKEKAYTYNLEANSNVLRAFDEKKLSFKLDDNEGVKHCHVNDLDLLRKLYDNKNKAAILSGYFISIQGVLITNISY